MKTLYLHIGQPKTGTTALQNFLAANSAELEAQGLSFPLMPFTWRFALPERNALFLSAQKTDETGVPLDEEDRAMRRRCLDIVLSSFEKTDAVLLSDEALWRHAAKDDLAFLRALLSHAQDNAYAIKVIVWLRRPDELAMSWHSQNAKSPYPNRALPWKNWLRRFEGRLDLLTPLERVSSLVGRDNVIVRVFDERLRGKGPHAIHDEFLGCLGLVRTDAMCFPESDDNTARLTPNFIACMDAVKRSPSFVPGRDNVFSTTACELSAAPSDTPRMQMFSAEEARAFVQARADDHVRIARDYLHTTAPLFDDAYPDIRKWTPGNRWLKSDALRYFCEVARRQNALAGYDEYDGYGEYSKYDKYDGYDEYGESPAADEATRDRPSAAALRHMMYVLAEEACARQKRIDAGDSVDVLTSDDIRARGEELL